MRWDRPKGWTFTSNLHQDCWCETNFNQTIYTRIAGVDRPFTTDLNRGKIKYNGIFLPKDWGVSIASYSSRTTYNFRSVPDPIRQEAFRFAGAFRAGLPELWEIISTIWTISPHDSLTDYENLYQQFGQSHRMIPWLIMRNYINNLNNLTAWFLEWLWEFISTIWTFSPHDSLTDYEKLYQ